MKKDVSERIAAIAAKENKVNARLNQSIFLVLHAEIYKAMEDGWSVKFIWETLHEEKKITVSYQRFAALVNRDKRARSQHFKQTAQEFGSPDQAEGFTFKSNYHLKELF